MDLYIVIPAHNEEDFIEQTLYSLLTQSYLAKQIVVVDDGSTDRTAQIVSKIAKSHNSVSLVSKSNNDTGHIPGAKVVAAFYAGLAQLDKKYDLICKFDADLIFPSDYLEELVNTFRENPKCGMAGGFCYIQKKDQWVLENLTGKDHIRGALKAYRKDLFESMGGIATTMGWDTVDEIKAQYLGWEIITLPHLKVKHLKPTGLTYHKKSKYKQGQAFYQMRYGLALTGIASLKLGIKKKSLPYICHCLVGYYKAKRKKAPFLLTKDEGQFLKRLRYKNIFKKLF